jgi:hypothetical protein
MNRRDADGTEAAENRSEIVLHPFSFSAFSAFSASLRFNRFQFGGM